MQRWFTFALLLATALGFGQAGRACAQTVNVTTAAGRTLAGAVDSRTDDNRLWLRQEQGGVVLATSVAWSEVATARVGNRVVAPEDLFGRRTTIASAPPTWLAATPSDSGARATPELIGGPRPQVRSVEVISACLANYDADVEPDGLIVAIAAIDERGAATAVRGNITARLFGERRPANLSDVTFGTLDQWTQSVKRGDFAGGVATYELRFRRTAPEWQFDLLPDALLEVTLLAYGEGRFSASAPVVVRAFNPLRDNQQLLLKTRFLPGEHHGPPPDSMPRSPDGRWLHWTW